MTAELMQVIRTDLLRRGAGVQGDPVRIVTQYWSTDGELLAEVDKWAESNPGFEEMAMVPPEKLKF